VAAIITNKFRIHNAQSFKEGFSEVADTKMYLGIGRPQSWDNENSPDTPYDTVGSEYYNWDDMLALKRIQSTDVSLSVVRRNWVSGKYYDIYRHDYDGTTTGVNIDSGATTTPASLYDANFYVITDEYNVYKCLKNTSNGNVVQSTVKPTGTDSNNITTSDGYIWKYMYTVAPADVLKFVSTDFIPVKTLGSNPGSTDSYYGQYLVEQAAVDGAIDRIVIDDFGSNYNRAASEISVTIIGDGLGAEAEVTTSDGQVKEVIVTNRGTGYTWARVEIGLPDLGSGNAAATAIISPKGGHGKDAVEELGGFYVMMNVRLEYDDGAGDFPIDNDYRRICLIRDPINFGASSVASNVTLIANRTISYSAVSGTFALDEEFKGNTSGARGRIVSLNTGSSPKTLRYIQTKDDGAGLGSPDPTIGALFQNGETIVGSTTGAQGTITGIADPDVTSDSGDIIYVENRRPINRAGDQIEDIKIIVEM
jgi:hypothetical protein